MKVLVILGKGLKERGADVESARVFGTLLLADYEVFVCVESLFSFLDNHNVVLPPSIFISRILHFVFVLSINPHLPIS